LIHEIGTASIFDSTGIGLISATGCGCSPGGVGVLHCGCSTGGVGVLRRCCSAGGVGVLRCGCVWVVFASSASVDLGLAGSSTPSCKRLLLIQV
jgi:hypothetical protein